MYLRKYMKCFQIIVSHQKCHNCCPISSIRRHFSSDDNKKSEENNEIIDERSDEKKELSIAEQKSSEETKVMSAKLKLSNLLNEMKVESSLTKSESVLSKHMAKPKFYIRRSARSEESLPEQENIDDVSKGIDKRLVVAAKVIANTMSGSAAKETESELLEMLRLHSKETMDAKDGKFVKNRDLASVFLGMKVDKQKPKTTPGMLMRDELSDDERLKRESMSSRIPRLPPIPVRARTHTSPKNKVNLYVSEPLGIFDDDMKEASDTPKLHIWERLMKDEVERTVIQPPSNAFEEMIRWTEQGKFWKYPINNEQGLEEEENVPFYEHVLLDHLLEGFPQKGPVRQFMELVLMGLSSNPYITVERKHATVQFYREYFKEKEDILRASGALG